MQTFLRKFSVVGGFSLLVLLLIVNAYVTRRQVEAQASSSARVIRTHQVLFELEQTEVLLLNAETGQRGYLFTGEPKYLTPYNQAAAEVDSHIQALGQLTAADPVQQANVAQLRSLARQKLDELAQAIALNGAGHADQAKALVLSDKGLLLMNSLRAVMADMRGEETRVEIRRTAAYLRSIGITKASIELATAIAIIGVILLAYFILREQALRDRHTREIRAREEWFRVTLTSIGDAVIATDEQGRTTFFNPIAEKLIGSKSSELLGKDIREVFPIFNEFTGNVVEDPVRKVIEVGTVVGLANHTVLQQADGHLVPIEDSAAPIRDTQERLLGVVLVFRDATAERRAQEIARKTEKLATAARLSATFAHEVNNPLEAVMNLVYVARTSSDTAMAQQSLQIAEQELERVAHLARQTLGFYRESKLPEEVEIENLIDSVLKLYSNRLRNKNITVERELNDCPPVFGVAGELRHVVSNLLSNAVDAVGQDGRIVLRSQRVEAPEGTMVQLTIEDSGPGIARADIDRIFEPFFTTKPDVGTGLGLWITKEIVNRHGGSILAQSRIEDGGRHGAAFTIRLPSRPDREPAAPSDATDSSAQPV